MYEFFEAYVDSLGIGLFCRAVELQLPVCKATTASISALCFWRPFFTCHSNRFSNNLSDQPNVVEVHRPCATAGSRAALGADANRNRVDIR